MAMNDNGWGGGKKNTDGPPDLDEIFRSLNQKLSRLLGGGSGNGAGGSPEGRSLFRGGASILLLILAGVWLASGLYVVGAREVGVVTAESVEDLVAHIAERTDGISVRYG